MDEHEGRDDYPSAGVIEPPTSASRERGLASRWDEIPKAFTVLAGRGDPAESLREDLRAQVKDRLTMREHPRAMRFVDELPKATTGTVRRRDLRIRGGWIGTDGTSRVPCTRAESIGRAEVK